MADPVSLGIMGAVSLAGSAASAGLGAIGAEKAAGAQSQSLNYQAAVSMLNAQIAEQNAEYARATGEGQAERYGMGARQKLGQIRASQGSTGLDVNSGSAKEVQQSAKIVTNMDMDQIRSNAAKTAYNYDVQAQGFKSSAVLGEFGAKNAAAAGDINAASSIVGGATSVASKWLQGSSMGLWSGLSGGGGASSITPDPLTQWSLGR